MADQPTRMPPTPEEKRKSRNFMVVLFGAPFVLGVLVLLWIGWIEPTYFPRQYAAEVAAQKARHKADDDAANAAQAVAANADRAAAVAADRASDAAIAAAHAAAGANAPSSETTSAWAYTDTPDPMRGRAERVASIVSTNTLDFGFPYNGGSSGMLTIMQSPKYGLNVILSVSKGQFVCNSFTGDHVSIKFDDRPIKRFSCSEAGAGRTDGIFLAPAKKLIADLKASHHAVVEAEFYQAGDEQLEFDTNGLKWPNG